MPGFFGDFDPTDPKTAALLGLMQGFGQAAMPSRAPIPFGAALGMGATGMLQGMQGAQQMKKGQQELLGGEISNDRNLTTENLFREALGMPPLGADGKPAPQAAKPDASVGLPAMVRPAVPQQGSVPAADDTASKMGIALSRVLKAKADAQAADPATAAAAPAGTPAEEAAPAPSNAALKSSLVSRLLFGSQPTDYQKARMYADSLPAGPAKVEAERAAAKAAGIDVSADARPGAVHLLWNPQENRYVIAFKNPQLPEGYTLDDDGKAIPVPGGPEAVSDIEGRKYEPHVKGKFRESSFENWLETGGNGLGQADGSVNPQGSETFAQRVAKLESGGDPAATNGNSSAEGAHQFLAGTWLEQAKKFLPKEAIQGKTDDQLLALRTDPIASAMVTNGNARENQTALEKAGIKNIGATELYLAHHFGAGGAQSILKAPANAPIDQILPAQVMAANPDLKGATVADVYSHARRGMSGLAAAPGGDQGDQTGTSIGGIKTAIPNVREAAPINKSEIYLKTRIPEWAKQETEWADAMPSNQIGEQRALAIGEALKATQAGHWAEDKAEVAAKLKSVGIDIGKNSWFGDPSAVQAAIKDNFASTLQQIRAFSSRPAAIEVQLASKNFANPNLQPEANLKIIGQTVGTMRWERAMVNDWAKAKAQGWQDPQDFQRAWMQKNPIQPFIDAATKEIGPLKGMKGAAQADAGVQKKITAENIAHTAKTHNMTEDQVKAQLRAAGYQVP